MASFRLFNQARRAADLGLTVAPDAADDRHTRDWLGEVGRDIAQGDYISGPLPAADIASHRCCAALNAPVTPSACCCWISQRAARDGRQQHRGRTLPN